MRLQEQIKQDLKTAMKEKDEERKNTLRVIMGEFGRAEKKELSDDEVVKILRSLLKSARETQERAGGGNERFIEIIESYLPQMADDAEIRAWIDENLDFSEYKNKMQAMRPIMQHFGSRADGNRVKEILQSM